MGVADWISAFAAVLAVITTIVMFIKMQKYRRLQFLLSSFSLIDVKRSIKDKIKIYYDGTIVSNLSMIKVKVTNSGKLAIRKEDVVSPIEIVFNEKTKLIDWSVATTEPAGININLERLDDENAIKCNFGLLNPGDEANLELICIPDDGSIPEVRTRIEGLKHVDVKVEGVEVMPVEMPSFYTKWTLTRVVSTLFGIIFLGAGTSGWRWYLESKFLSVLIAESIMSIIAIMLLVLGLIPTYLYEKFKFKIDEYKYIILVVMLIFMWVVLNGIEPEPPEGWWEY